MSGPDAPHGETPGAPVPPGRPPLKIGPVPARVIAMPPRKGAGGRAVGPVAPLAAGRGLADRSSALIWDNRRLQKTLLDHVELGLALLSMQGEVLTANRALYKMLGYASPELKGVAFADLVDRSDGSAALPPLPGGEAEPEALRHRVEKCLWRKEGGMIWASVTLAPVSADEGMPQMLMVTVENITARKLMHERLVKAQAQYRAMVDFQNELVYRMAPDGILRFVNEAFATYFGSPAHRLVGMSLTEVLPPSETSKIREHLVRLTPGQPEEKLEIRAGPTQTSRWLKVFHHGLFSPRGELVEIQGVGHDMTLQVNAERERNLLTAAVENAGEGIFITNSQFEIEYANRACEGITGYARGDLMGQTPRILKGPEYDEAFFESVMATLEAGQSWAGRATNQRKDGTAYDADEVITPFRDEQVGGEHYVAVVRDMSNEVALEAQVRLGQKMEALGMLAGGIAHDFNNVLAIIMMYAQLALGDVPDDASHAQLRAQLGEITKASRRGRDLVLSLTSFSRKSDYSVRKPVQVGLVVGEALRMLRPTLPENIRIHQKIDKTSCRVLADPTQIHQVVVNLCNNALHAMREAGGTLGVELARTPIDPDMLTDPGDPAACTEFVRLTVCDDGPGMDRATMERIFEPFFTTKPAGEGTGLGLANVRNIVGSHAGGIQVDSVLGEGATFTVYLPACTEDGPDLPLDEPVPFSPRGREHILLVDDEPAIVHAGHTILTQLGYQVTVSTSAEEALGIFIGQPDAFDLIISDLNMPSISGEELAVEAMRIRKEIPVILITGYSALVSDGRARRLGVKALLTKPFVGQQLAEAVREALDPPAPEP